jgi:hypothetical protein
MRRTGERWRAGGYPSRSSGSSTFVEAGRVEVHDLGVAECGKGVQVNR